MSSSNRIFERLITGQDGWTIMADPIWWAKWTHMGVKRELPVAITGLFLETPNIKVPLYNRNMAGMSLRRIIYKTGHDFDRSQEYLHFFDTCPKFKVKKPMGVMKSDGSF